METQKYSTTLTATGGGNADDRASICVFKALQESQCTIADFNVSLADDQATLAITFAGTAEQCAIAQAVVDGWSQSS